MGATKKQKTVLVVDDEQVHRYVLRSMLDQWGWQCVEADDGDTAVEAVHSRSYDAVLMDVRMARMSGYEAFARIHRDFPALPVIIMTAYSSIDDAVDVIKKGAHDYLTKPLDFDRLRITLSRALDGSQVAAQKHAAPAQPQTGLKTRIIGESAVMQELLETISFVAPTQATVLITGESGTGKELVAETVHANSDRAKHPFIKVNCAAFAENLLESELFGHEKGAFTGAERQRDGLFSQADGGTLFLDEIGETSLAMQVKLLRTLQEGEVQRVGGDQPVTVDVRIIAATNRNLLEQVEQGRFREDLYYRLNVVTLEIAPLRDRGDDIVLLAHHFAAGYAEKNRRSFTSLTPECRQVLTAYSWPGNVRELQNSMERGIILMRGEQLTEKSLPLHIQREAQAKTIVDPRPAATLQEAEKALILQTLAEADGNKSEAARRLGITRKTLLKKITSYDSDS
ncbi:MAG: sigma-54-dependent Fis family transcriptional regulator [Desulfofustis sp. PB-SRB1]|mgnify:CR=1 FL=1|jgi:two-component system response regulator HydG|nr:sigma-54-dependent Fis family transcriptional regulator [Desulfofustis sp. PB-SRB1]MBM1001120.1 sigma-54-dependent Fis family transcriptional regulator [Desulfofustis sp. PB-SRB1]HBH29330.1 sigma-54-dependent Fis family transcriptional regulator [Desulfofustis sp.]HBH30592.1 sigma-54-dependent Fis family transcriptional regulator [Desulfofustis sp.]